MIEWLKRWFKRFDEPVETECYVFGHPPPLEGCECHYCKNWTPEIPPKRIYSDEEIDELLRAMRKLDGR